MSRGLFGGWFSGGSEERKPKKRLRANHLDYDHYELETVDSTNEAAKWYIEENGLEEASFFYAREQTAGRGRLGRSFYSPADTGLYLTLAWPLPYDQYESQTEAYTSAVRVTGKAAVAVVRGLGSLLSGRFQIKWVNDIYYYDRKICGILTETVPRDGVLWLIVGIGLNLDTTDFPEEIENKAGSVSDLPMRPEMKTWIREAIEDELLKEIIQLDEIGYVEDYRQYSCVIGKRVHFDRGEGDECGIAEDIGFDGALVVRMEDDSQVRLSTGEISLELEPEIEEEVTEDESDYSEEL